MEFSEDYKDLPGTASNQKLDLRAARIVVIFLAFSILWLFVSDYIVDTSLVATSWGTSVDLGTVKALFYFMVTAAFIYLGISRFQSRIEKTDFQKVLYFNECLYPIFILDRQKLTILDANPAATKLYGFARRDLQTKSLQFFQTEPVVPLVNGKQQVNHRNKWNSSFKAVVYWQTVEVGGIEVYCLHVLTFLSYIPDGAVNLAWEANEKLLLQKMARLEECVRRMALQIKDTDETSAELKEQSVRFEEAGRMMAERAHNAAIEKASDLNDLIESLDEIVWSFNVQEMRFEFLSSSIERVFDIRKDEFLAKPDWWESCIHPLDKHVIAERRKAVANETRADFQFRIITGRGQIRWISEQLKMVRDERGNLLKVKGVSSDISYRKSNEEKQRRRQAILDSIFDNSQEDFLVLNTEGAILMFNRRAERHSAIFCTSPEAGKNFFQTFSGGQQLVAENRFRQALEMKIAISEEMKCLLASGETMWYNYSFVPVLDESGAVQTLCFHGRDITQSKGMEDALRMTKKNVEALINNTADWLWSVDTNGRLTTFNESLSNFVQEEQGISIELKTHLDPCGPFDEKWERNVQLGLQGQRILTSGYYKNAAGEIRYYEAAINPIQEQGLVVGTACLLRDITPNRIMMQKSIELNRRFRLLSKATNDAVWEWKKENNLITWNRAISTVFGFKPGDVPDFWSMMKLVHPDDRQSFTDDLTCRVEAGERVSSSRIRFCSADGSYRHVLCRSYIHYLKGDPEIIVGSLQDITRLVEAESAERMGNERYQLASRATGDAIYDHDLVTDNVCWSDGYRDLFYYDDNNESGQQWLNKIHPEDRDDVWASLKAVFDSGEATSWRSEYRLQRNNGAYAHVLDRGFLLRNEHGKALRLIGAVMDQTEKMMYIAEIRRLSTVASRTNSMVLICRDDFSIEWANQSFLQNLGTTLQDVSDKPCQSFFAKRLANPFAFDKIKNLLCSGQNAKEELGIRDAAGIVTWWRIDGSPTQTDAGQERQFIMIFSDVSEQKAYESKILNVARELANLIERANAVIFGVDRNGYVNEWNEVTAAVTGYTKNEALGRKLPEFISGLDSDHQIVNDLRQGRSVANVELVLPAKSGKQVMLLLNATPRRDTNGVVTGALIVGQDVTELVEYRTELERKVEERTRELNEALQQQIELVNMKRRFVSVASHEFRTPLSTINFSATYLRRYKKKIGEAETEQKLATIQQQVKHMSYLLEDVLTISKNESNKIKVNLIPVDVILLLDTISQEVVEAHGRTHSVRILSKAGKELSMPGDSNLLRNIFVNIINNAVKFSPGKPEVMISIEIIDQQVVINVRDNGIGIPPEDLRNIFDAFHRGTNTAGIEGTGLGLNIVKRAVELMSGTISVKSEPGQGSTFTIILPLFP